MDWCDLLLIFDGFFWQWIVPAFLIFGGVSMAGSADPMGYALIASGVVVWFLVRRIRTSFRRWLESQLGS